MSPGGLEWIPFAKQRGKNTEILALFGMREQVSKEYQFVCSKISLLNETNIWMKMKKLYQSFRISVTL